MGDGYRTCSEPGCDSPVSHPSHLCGAHLSIALAVFVEREPEPEPEPEPLPGCGRGVLAAAARREPGCQTVDLAAFQRAWRPARPEWQPGDVPAGTSAWTGGTFSLDQAGLGEIRVAPFQPLALVGAYFSGLSADGILVRRLEHIGYGLAPRMDTPDDEPALPPLEHWTLEGVEANLGFIPPPVALCCNLKPVVFHLMGPPFATGAGHFMLACPAGDWP